MERPAHEDQVAFGILFAGLLQGGPSFSYVSRERVGVPGYGELPVDGLSDGPPHRQ